MQSSARPRRVPVEPRSGAVSGARADGPDLNRERLVYCITSLVGHRVTAKLRNNVIYEGLFHSCSLENDYSITLKWARRLPSEAASRSGEVVRTLVIPGKDFLQVSAVNLPSPCMPTEKGSSVAGSGRGFATDTEISSRKMEPGTERELVAWSDSSGPPAPAGGLDEKADANWDQFQANKNLYGVTTTYDEALYTTRLDKEAIPKEQRDRAERIAREIESGTMHENAENDTKVDADDGDEEARFSAVGGAAAQGKKDAKEEKLPVKAASMPLAQIPPMPQSRELAQHDALSNLSNENFTRDLRNKRGMISEMKRINALNLEPTLPKLDDSTRNARINFKESQARNASRMPQGSGDLKMEFQQSLEVIQKQEASKQRKAQGASAEQRNTGAHGPSPGGQAGGSGASDGQWNQQQGQNFMMPYQQKPDGQGPQGGYPGQGGDSSRSKSSFSFNPQAKAFSLNPQAGEFTPSSGASTAAPGNATVPAGAQQPPQNQQQPQQPQQQQAVSKPSGPAPTFNLYKKSPELLRKNLVEILEPFFQKAAKSAPDSLGPEWPDAKGPSFHEVLGQPNPSTSQHALMRPMPGQGGPGPQPGWQQQQAPDQGQPGGGPGNQMMQQAFVVNAPPGGPPSGMYPQMYIAPGGQPGGPNPQQNMQPQQQNPAMFGQQTMMGQGPPQSMAAVPVGMVQGQNPGQVGMGMGPVPKFGGQQQMVVMPVMLAPGQQGFMPQGFIPQQGGPSGPQGPGPQGPPGQQGQDGQQGMMQQPMYHRQGAG